MKSPFLKFLISRVFFKNLLIMAGVTLIIIIVVQVTLRFYTEHGKEVSVPDFSGMTLQEVDQLCFQRDILWVKQDSIYVRDSIPGIVLDQYPSAGSKVKRKRKIFLTTNAWSPETIKMPKAYEMPFRQAIRTLESVGLFVADTEYVPYYKAYVRDQKFNGEIIPEGTPIQKGSGITLVIGQGLSNERATVPVLLNLTRDKAQELALENYFNLGAVIYDPSVVTQEDSAQALVFRQFPGHLNQKAQLGATIDIWLTIDSLTLYRLDSMLYPVDSLSSDTLIFESYE